MVLTHDIEQGKHAKKITRVLFMGVSGAIENVSNNHLLQTL
jgi:hypothetical protein